MKVLIVDDDANLRMITQIALEGVANWSVVEAASGKEALQKVQTEKPDVILLDMMMPEMDGLTTLRLLKKTEPDLRVIFLTAKVQRPEVEGYLSEGIVGVISKPFDPMTLHESITAMLGDTARSSTAHL